MFLVLFLNVSFYIRSIQDFIHNCAAKTWEKKIWSSQMKEIDFKSNYTWGGISWSYTFLNRISEQKFSFKIRLHIRIDTFELAGECITLITMIANMSWGLFSTRLCVFVCVCVCTVAKSCLTFCDSMDCSLPGSSVHGIFQARILGWSVISSSRGSSQPRDRTHVSTFPELAYFPQYKYVSTI